MANLALSWRAVFPICSFSYTYLHNDDLASLTLPSGRTLSYTHDDAGRITSLTSGANAYTSNYAYTPHGAASQMLLGSGKTEQTCFNSRLQATKVRLGSGTTTNCVLGGGDLLHLGLDYGATNNNGNLVSQTITAPKTAGGNLVLTQNYIYDALNRLQGAAEGGAVPGSCPGFAGPWCRRFGYDAWGNRSITSQTGLGSPPSINSFNTATNQLTLAGYDDSGNMTADTASGTMAYDAENRMTAFNDSLMASNNRTYGYDGEGRRVRKTAPSTGIDTIYVYDAFGRLAAEYSESYSLPVGISFRTNDHLGSTRLVTDYGGEVISRHDYSPFGEEIPSGLGSRSLVAGYGDPGLDQKFTGKQRDGESGSDYFKTRYHSSSMGRFASPDPISYNLLRVISPQRWNRYPYAVNNPLQFVDPDGRDAISVNFSQPAIGMGHQGIIAVGLDGSATYGDFGPSIRNKPVTWNGKFTVRDLKSKAVFDSSGLPTEESLQQMLNEVAEINNKAEPATVSFAYFKTTAAETLALSVYLENARRREIDGDAPPYIVGFSDCSAFCSQGLRSAGIGDGSRVGTIPNIFQFLAVQVSDAKFSGKTGKREVNRKGSREEVKSTFIPCTPDKANSEACRGAAQ